MEVLFRSQKMVVKHKNKNMKGGTYVGRMVRKVPTHPWMDNKLPFCGLHNKSVGTKWGAETGEVGKQG